MLYRNRITKKSKLTDFNFAIHLNLSLKSIKRLEFAISCVILLLSPSISLSLEHAYDAVRKLFDGMLFVWRLNENFYNFYTAIKYILYIEWVPSHRISHFNQMHFIHRIFICFFFHFHSNKKIKWKLFRMVFFCVPHFSLLSIFLQSESLKQLLPNCNLNLRS